MFLTNFYQLYSPLAGLIFLSVRSAFHEGGFSLAPVPQYFMREIKTKGKSICALAFWYEYFEMMP
jgi:hypothetical protein